MKSEEILDGDIVLIPRGKILESEIDLLLQSANGFNKVNKKVQLAKAYIYRSNQYINCFINLSQIRTKTIWNNPSGCKIGVGKNGEILYKEDTYAHADFRFGLYSSCFKGDAIVKPIVFKVVSEGKYERYVAFDNLFSNDNIVIFYNEKCVIGYPVELDRTDAIIQSVYDSPMPELSASILFQTEQKRLHSKAWVRWTQEEDEELQSLYKQNTTIEQLMDIFGRSEGSIMSRLNKFQLIDDITFRKYLDNKKQMNPK